MIKKLTNKEEFLEPISDIPILLKIGGYFIPNGNIQSVLRFGKGSKIILTSGDELLVPINYDKVVEMVG